MDRRTACIPLLLAACLSVTGASAQETKKIAPPNPVAVGVPSGNPVNRHAIAPALSSKTQTEIVQKVSRYFNQLTGLKGSFVQTSADKKRLRGKFSILHPGRFRFDFSPPSRLVIISDGRYVAIQDRDLNTDDRWNLSDTPFRALFKNDVDLLRDAHIFEVQETDDTIAIAFEDKGAEAASRIKLFLATKPVLQLKGWITDDLQGYETRIDLGDVVKADALDTSLFNTANPGLDKLR